MVNKTFTIEFSGVKELEQKFPVAVHAGAQVGIQKSILLLENAVKTNIAQGRPGGHGGAVATGTLLGAVFSEMMGTPVNPYGIVAVSPPADRYGLVVEEGRRPGQKMPPPEALILWVRRKFRDAISVTATVLGKGGQPRRSKKKAAATERGLAFVIARSIGKKGFPGVHMFRRAFTEHTADVQKIITEEIQGAVATIGR